MKMARIIFRILFIMIILFMVTRIFEKADEKDYSSGVKPAFSKGNASDTIRREVIGQLQKFQEGYAARDVSKIDSFMKTLYSESNILVLGTMKGEIFEGFDEATNLVRSDWKSWGDCRFAVENASVSSNGQTAWIATTGYVKFDLSKLLVLPLRFTAIMVKEDGTWKFQQQQFQFDMDYSFGMLAVFLLFLWLAGNVIALFVMLFKNLKNHKLST
jgi:hypothetical protein